MERQHTLGLARAAAVFAATAANPLSAMFGFGSHRMAHQPGAGALRARQRLRQHRLQQAQRVAPAEAALAGRRQDIARKRVLRWQESNPTRDRSKAPGHIQRMWRELRGRA